MRQIFYILISSFFFAACATNGPDLSGALGTQIRTAAADVTLLTADTPDVCQTTSKCKLIGGYVCTSDQVKKRDDCKRDAKIDTVVHGGDTFLIHTAQTTPGGSALYPNEDYFRLYGQIYNCSGKNQDLQKQYASTHRPSALTPVNAVSAQYATQCKTLDKCKKFRSFNRSSISADPFRLIMMDFGKVSYKFNQKFNYVVIQKDIFNNAGFYRLYTDTYLCN